MLYIQHLIESKGAANLVKRFASICNRFGLSSTKSKAALQRMHEITKRHDCTPTFFVTADLVDHNRSLIKWLSEAGIEIALHGHHHIDHARLCNESQRFQIRRGLEKFKELGIGISGFRAPFLRFNDGTDKAVVDNGISWVSQTAMVMRESMSRAANGGCNSLHLVENFYTCHDYAKVPSIPRLKDGCVEIPVSLPDDEILIDRLGTCNSQDLSEIWLKMLEESYRRGELFTFLCHPERIDFFSEPLDRLLLEASEHKDLWIASMGQIAEWWRMRAASRLEVVEENGSYRVNICCPPGVDVVIEKPEGASRQFIKAEDHDTFTIRSKFKPVISISPGFCSKGGSCLTNEGFIVDQTSAPGDCALSFTGVCSRSRRHLLEAVKNARGPLIRVWRWPNRCRCALAITADIDAISLWDFIYRVYCFHCIRGNSV